MANQSARLRIEKRDPNTELVRVTGHDVRLFLNDVELTTWRNFELSCGLEKGAMRLKLDLWIDDIEADADIFASLQKPSCEPLQTST